MWNAINNEFWVTWTSDLTILPSGQGYYAYQAQQNELECEAGGFEQIMIQLLNAYPTLGNSSRLLEDMETRYLDQNWTSPQWTTYGAIIHANNYGTTGTTLARLQNTIMALASLLGFYPVETSTDQATIQKFLTGGIFNGSYYQPMWQLLYNSSTGLYDSSTGLFRPISLGSGGTDSMDATAEAASLLMMEGIVPQTAVLAVPLEELQYEYVYNIIDSGIYQLNLTAHTLTLGIGSPGSLEFLYNATTNYNFAYSGVWTIHFDSNWNNIVSATLISGLPTNRVYVGVVLNQNTLQIYGNSGGTTDPTAGSYNYTQGLQVSVSETPNIGAVFNNWIVNGTASGSTNPLTFTITGGTTVEANFTYPIVPYTDSHSQITPASTVQVTPGGNQYFNYSANNGYTVQSVLVDGSPVAITGSYTFSNVTISHTISVSTSSTIEYINATSDGGSIIYPSGLIAVNYGFNQSFATQANSGYAISAVLVDGSAEPLTGNYLFTNVMANHTIAVYSVVSTVPGQPNGNGNTIIINPTPAPTAPSETTTPNGETQATTSYYNLVFVIGSISIVGLVGLIMYSNTQKKRSKVHWERY
jgi:hypothetical protein